MDMRFTQWGDSWDMLRNTVIEHSLAAWAIAQVLKTLVGAVMHGRLDLSLMVRSGGMPSCHSAAVTACAVAVGRADGVAGPVFGLAVLVAAVVMYDACNVRRSAGDTAKIVNRLLARVEKLDAEGMAESLKEVMGHTPLQVLAGCVLGLAVGFL